MASNKEVKQVRFYLVSGEWVNMSLRDIYRIDIDRFVSNKDIYDITLAIWTLERAKSLDPRWKYSVKVNELLNRLKEIV